MEAVKVLDDTGNEQITQAVVPGVCLLCQEIHAEAFPWMSDDQFEHEVTGDGGDADVKASHLEAHSNLQSNSFDCWGQQELQALEASLSLKDIVYDGYTEEGYSSTHNGLSVKTLNIPPVSEIHPLTREELDIYYVPAPGPLFQLRFRSKESTSWIRQMMRKQVYQNQGRHMLQHLAARMEPGYTLQDVLISPAEYSRRVAVSRRAQPPGSKPGSTSGGISGATPQQSGHPMHQTAVKPRINMSALQSRPVAAPSWMPRSGNGLALLGKPALQAQALRLAASKRVAEEVGGPSLKAKRPTTDVAPETSPSSRAITPGLGSVSTPVKKASAPVASPPPSKVRRSGSFGVNGELLASTDFSAPGSARVPSFAARTGHPSSGASEAGSCATSLESAISKVPIIGLLMGQNLTTAMSNFKRTVTLASKNGNPDAEALVAHQKILEVANDMTWSRMQALEWPTLVDHARSLAKDWQPQLPKSVFANYCMRYALQFTAPNSRNFEDKMFFEIVSLAQVSQKPAYNVDKPMLNCNIFDADDLESIQVPAFVKLIDLVFVNEMSKEFVNLAGLFTTAKLIYTHISELAKDIVKLPTVQMLLQKARVIFLLYADIPGFKGAALHDLDSVLRARKDNFAEILKTKAPHKAHVDNIWSLALGEKDHWESIKVLCQKMDSGTDMNIHVRTIIDKWGEWVEQIRPSVTKHLRESSIKYLVQAMSSQDWESNAGDDGKVALLELAKDASGVFQDRDLFEQIAKASAFSRRVAQATMTTRFVDALKILGEFIADESLEARVQACVGAVPRDASSKIVIGQSDDLEAIKCGVETLLETTVEKLPHAVNHVKSAQGILNAIMLSDTIEDAMFTTTVQTIRDDMQKFNDCISMHCHLETYMKLGDSAAARRSADKKQNSIKMVIASMKRVGKLSETMKAALQKQKTETTEKVLQEVRATIQERGKQEVAALEPGLQAAIDALRPMSKGSADGKSWKEACRRSTSGRICMSKHRRPLPRSMMT